MSQLIDVFSADYARPDYLASLQVLLNMDHDPRTSSEVRKTMLEVAERSNPHVRRLLREALGPAANKPDLSTAIFVVIRGFAFSQQLLDSMAYDTLAPKRDRGRRHRRLLAEMLAPQRRNGSEIGALTVRIGSRRPWAPRIHHRRSRPQRPCRPSGRSLPTEEATVAGIVTRMVERGPIGRTSARSGIPPQRPWRESAPNSRHSLQ